MFEQTALSNIQLKGFLNAYTNSIKCVAYNSRGNPISISLPNYRNTFGLHSFQAMAVYHDNFKLKVTAYRSNIIFAVKIILLTKNKPTLFEIDWEQIHKITFTPELICDTGKPETFILTSLNLVL
jgi:hypothetical protein